MLVTTTLYNLQSFYLVNYTLGKGSVIYVRLPCCAVF